MNRLSRCGLFYLLLLVAAFAGCSPPPRTIEVSGRVTLDGQPVERALVLFLTPYQNDRPAFGVTDADGRYELSTYFSKNDIPLGAVPGRYAVIVEKRRRPNLARAMRKIAALPRGPKRQNYIDEQAMRDIWPDGVPEGWPLGFIPSVMPMPKLLLEDKDARETYNRLTQGIHLLPEKYAQAESTPFKADIDRSQGQWSFDFDLHTEQ